MALGAHVLFPKAVLTRDPHKAQGAQDHSEDPHTLWEARPTGRSGPNPTHVLTQDRPQSHKGPHSHEGGGPLGEPLQAGHRDPTAAVLGGDGHQPQPRAGEHPHVPGVQKTAQHYQAHGPESWALRLDEGHPPCSPWAQDVQLWLPTALGDSTCFFQANLSKTKPSPHPASADYMLALHRPPPEKLLAPSSPFVLAMSVPAGIHSPCREPTSLHWEIKGQPHPSGDWSAHHMK